MKWKTRYFSDLKVLFVHKGCYLKNKFDDYLKKKNILFFLQLQQGVLEEFDDIVLAVGSGGTAEGIAIGNYLTGSKLRLVYYTSFKMLLYIVIYTHRIFFSHKILF